MGKPREKSSKKNKVNVQPPPKIGLEEQITSGRVAKSKNRVKIRLRAEEDEVSHFKYTGFYLTSEL